MDDKTKERLRALVIGLYGRARTNLYYSRLTDEEYVGYVTALVTNQTQDLVDVSMFEVLTLVRELHKRGQL